MLILSCEKICLIRLRGKIPPYSKKNFDDDMGEYPERNSSGDYLVFIPPVDDVKPIPVPVEIYTQCITDASRFFGIDAELVFTLFDNEGGKVGTFSRNKNGTYDIGPMQINSSNLPEIRDHFPSVTWRVLAYDACASFWVGTWC
uniref:Putative lipoprotein n=1 Tax=Escherichia coli TaxID=562 RepID=A0A6G6AKH4_ECOLX|nr:putative lipoprotein [Escherichia coli]QID23036.1 putative lipoprotein [Escherichia coli]QID23479.1 putative lipoprotein [Escherichia coli]